MWLIRFLEPLGLVDERLGSNAEWPPVGMQHSLCQKRSDLISAGRADANPRGTSGNEQSGLLFDKRRCNERRRSVDSGGRIRPGCLGGGIVNHGSILSNISVQPTAREIKVASQSHYDRHKSLTIQ